MKKPKGIIVFKKQNSGITLMALVITIIVLLILAGICLESLTGEDGLIANVIRAKEQSEITEEKEFIKTAAVQAMNKNRHGDITMDELQKELENDAIVEKIRRKIVVTINDSKRTYYVDDSGNVFEYEKVELAIMEDGHAFYTRMADYRESILSVEVLDNINIPENAYKVFDVSKDQNGTVKAWIVKNTENTDMYDLYIGSKEGVEILDCQNMFANLKNCLTIDIENLYTSNVTNFNYMFANSNSLTSINMNNIDTTNATSLNSMFGGCKMLEYINLAVLDTKNVTDMGGMFYACEKLEQIDVSNFSTTNVKSMNQMFRQCLSLKILDLSNFDVTNLTRTDLMFYYANKLEIIYTNQNWSDYTNITKSDNMFLGCSSLKSENLSYDAEKVDISYANYDIGYFTYKKSD